MDSFDLNIDNYTIDELKDFLKLNNNYEIKDVNDRVFKLQNVLINHENIDKKYKTNIIEFLQKATNILVDNNKAPTLIKKNDNVEFLIEPPVLERTENIIKRDKTNYVLTQNTEYLSGNLNPLVTRTIKKNITIDTRFRKDYYYNNNNEFTITLPFKLSKVVNMKLVQIEFPTNFYNISSKLGNHFLNISAVSVLDGLMTKGSKIIIVPDGYYTTEELVNIIDNILCPKNDTGSIIDPTDMFSSLQIKFDTISQKVIICPRGDFYFVNIILDFRKDIHGNEDNLELYTKIGWMLGYQKPFYENSSFFTSDMIVEKIPTRYFYLCVDDFNNSSNNSFMTPLNDSIFNKNVLARINSINNSIHFLSSERSYFGSVDVLKLRFSLYDSFGKIISSSYFDYSFCIEFTLIYDL
jgi:hypothetical protein